MGVGDLQLIPRMRIAESNPAGDTSGFLIHEVTALIHAGEYFQTKKDRFRGWAVSLLPAVYAVTSVVRKGLLDVCVLPVAALLKPEDIRTLRPNLGNAVRSALNPLMFRGAVEF